MKYFTILITVFVMALVGCAKPEPRVYDNPATFAYGNETEKSKEIMFVDPMVQPSGTTQKVYLDLVPDTSNTIKLQDGYKPPKRVVFPD